MKDIQFFFSDLLVRIYLLHVSLFRGPLTLLKLH